MAQVLGSGEIDRQLSSEPFGCGLNAGNGVYVARVGNQHLDWAHGIDRGKVELIDRVRIGQIERRSEGFSSVGSDCFGGFLASIDAACAEHDRIAGVRQRYGDRLADAAGSARNDVVQTVASSGLLGVWCLGDRAGYWATRRR